MKLVFQIFLFLFACLPILSDNSPSSPTAECSIPTSFGMRAGAHLPATSPVTPPPANPVTTATTTGVTTASVVSVVTLTPGSVAQGARGAITLQLANCAENTALGSEALPWNENPTQLSISDDALQYHRGAVVGNWALVSGIAAAHAAFAKYKGIAQARFPGALILPALFLIPPTASTSSTLVRLGSTGDKILGTFSLTLQAATTVGTFAVLTSNRFHALWNPIKSIWTVNPSHPDYLESHGLLFKEYQDSRQWFQGVELAFSMAAGILDSYQVGVQSCSKLLNVATITYGVYAGALVILNPYSHPVDRVYFTTVAVGQASSLLLITIGNQINSTTTADVGNYIGVATQWLVTARSVYDFFRQARAFFKYTHSLFFGNPKNKLMTPTLQEMGDALLNDDPFAAVDLPPSSQTSTSPGILAIEMQPYLPPLPVHESISPANSVSDLGAVLNQFEQQESDTWDGYEPSRVSNPVEELNNML